ncbi:HXB5A protein, partial [Polyodon spathula]|nr:HXB5A protein [Polyodon spathula]
MSSYFVNSFSGRYPNGPDYQLLNYGTSSSAMNGTYRDTGTMHSGSYGYNYNGMDLSVNRSNTPSHFGAVGERSDPFQSPAQESRFRQPSSCSLSSPESLPCSNSETLGPKSSSPPVQQQQQPQEGAASSTTPTSEGQPPQIFPWMRKLHISHGCNTSKPPLEPASDQVHSQWIYREPQYSRSDTSLTAGLECGFTG